MYDIKAEAFINTKSLEYFDKIIDAIFDPDETYTNHEMLSIAEAALKLILALEEMLHEQHDMAAQIAIANGLKNAQDMLRLNATEQNPQKLN